MNAESSLSPLSPKEHASKSELEKCREEVQNLRGQLSDRTIEVQELRRQLAEKTERLLDREMDLADESQKLQSVQNRVDEMVEIYDEAQQLREDMRRMNDLVDEQRSIVQQQSLALQVVERNYDEQTALVSDLRARLEDRVGETLRLEQRLDLNESFHDFMGEMILPVGDERSEPCCLLLVNFGLLRRDHVPSRLSSTLSTPWTRGYLLLKGTRACLRVELIKLLAYREYSSPLRRLYKNERMLVQQSLRLPDDYSFDSVLDRRFDVTLNRSGFFFLVDAPLAVLALDSLFRGSSSALATTTAASDDVSFAAAAAAVAASSSSYDGPAQDFSIDGGPTAATADRPRVTAAHSQTRASRKTQLFCDRLQTMYPAVKPCLDLRRYRYRQRNAFSLVRGKPQYKLVLARNVLFAADPAVFPSDVFQALRLFQRLLDNNLCLWSRRADHDHDDDDGFDETDDTVDHYPRNACGEELYDDARDLQLIHRRLVAHDLELMEQLRQYVERLCRDRVHEIVRKESRRRSGVMEMRETRDDDDDEDDDDETVVAAEQVELVAWIRSLSVVEVAVNGSQFIVKEKAFSCPQIEL